ncbi:unnamed protein product [Brachionus calyciflorus]|uniref:Uncharacterized protein n=1 Tax=Brachionus calyciflorus TaxID=104777 RepID=A0A814K9H2_9BILA|nr:unnamed protein product [Brachionus calyciflorus]
MDDSTSYEFVPHHNQSEETIQDAEELENVRPKKVRGKNRIYTAYSFQYEDGDADISLIIEFEDEILHIENEISQEQVNFPMALNEPMNEQMVINECHDLIESDSNNTELPPTTQIKRPTGRPRKNQEKELNKPLSKRAKKN